MAVKIKMVDHLIIPFGCPQWDIEKLKVVGVSAGATYLESQCPCVHIYRPDQKPLRLNSIGDVFPESVDSLILIDDPKEAFYYIRNYLKVKGNLQTESEHRFLDLYFKKVDEQVTPGENNREVDPKELPIPVNRYEWCFYALMPLPQAHIGVLDALAGDFASSGPKAIKVDFAFWTGKRLVAVDILYRENYFRSKEGFHKERLLQNAGVRFIRIPEEKLLRCEAEHLADLLPRDVNVFWDGLTMDDFFPSPVKLLIKLF